MKLLIVITGGTFSSNATNNGVGIINSVDTKLLDNSIKSHITNTDIQTTYIVPIFKLSENIDDKDWAIINDSITKNMQGNDAILVIHGTDTMAYTSAMLSFNENLSKKYPIVTTGANSPLAFENSDAIVNFIQSIQVLQEFIAKKITGSFIVFNGTNSFDNKALIHMGNRVKKDKWEENCYRSFYINSHEIGFFIRHEFYFDFKEYNNLFKKNIVKNLTPNFNSRNFSSFKIYPGFDPDILTREFDAGKKYFLLEIYNSGTAPISNSYLSLEKALSYVHSNGGIVFAISQHEGKRGATMNIYESSHKLKKLNLVPLKDMIWETAVVKLNIVLSNFSNNTEIIDAMVQNISGEISD